MPFRTYQPTVPIRNFFQRPSAQFLQETQDFIETVIKPAMPNCECMLYGDDLIVIDKSKQRRQISQTAKKPMKLFNKRRPIKTKLLKQWRTEAQQHLYFSGKWSGKFVTSIDGIIFESTRISSFKYVVDDDAWFIRGVLLAMVRLEREPHKKSNAIYRQRLGLPCMINEDGGFDNYCCL